MIYFFVTEFKKFLLDKRSQHLIDPSANFRVTRANVSSLRKSTSFIVFRKWASKVVILSSLVLRFLACSRCFGKLTNSLALVIQFSGFLDLL